jgi:hypothetical protein
MIRSAPLIYSVNIQLLVERFNFIDSSLRPRRRFTIARRFRALFSHAPLKRFLK